MYFSHDGTIPTDLGYNNVPWNNNSVTVGKLPHLQRMAKDALFLPLVYEQRATLEHRSLEFGDILSLHAYVPMCVGVFSVEGIRTCNDGARRRGRR